jgi:hypothetical protein
MALALHLDEQGADRGLAGDSDKIVCSQSFDDNHRVLAFFGWVLKRMFLPRKKQQSSL